jgi:hypothetical protein
MEEPRGSQAVLPKQQSLANHIRRTICGSADKKQRRSDVEHEGEGVKRRPMHYSMKRRQLEKGTNDD